MRSLAFAIAVIVLAVVVIQGPTVRHGLILDDFNHRAELRAWDGSWQGLVDASRLGDPRRRVRMWWQDEAELRFFRPVSFLLMWTEYRLAGWRPEVMHAFSLVWHATCGALVVLLTARLLSHSPEKSFINEPRASARAASAYQESCRFSSGYAWSLLAGLLFVLHPGNALTVRWIACQNQQMSACFLLAAILLYGRGAGWWFNLADRGITGRRGVLLMSLACFAAALGCREDAIVFPAIVVLGDALLGTDGLRKRWWAYAVLAVVAMVYLAARHTALDGWSMPGRPYAWPPGSPGFVRFVFDKTLYYLLGLFACVPIVGFAGLNALRAHPGLFYGGMTLLLVIVLGLYRWSLHRQILRFCLVLTVVPLLPTLPVFESSHHLYLASAGAAILVVAWASEVVRRASTVAPGTFPAIQEPAAELASKTPRQEDKAINGGGELPSCARVTIVALLVLVVIAFAGANLVYDTGFAGMCASGQLPVREVDLLARPMKPGDRLFFINLPMLAFNCMPAIEEARDVAPLRGHVLTFAPAFLRMDRRGYVEQVGPNQLCVWLDDPGYFTGLAGQHMMEAVGRDRPFAIGETWQTDDFRVEIVNADAAGVQELLFTFVLPLNDPTYHFFFGSPTFAAYSLPLSLFRS